MDGQSGATAFDCNATAGRTSLEPSTVSKMHEVPNISETRDLGGTYQGLRRSFHLVVSQHEKNPETCLHPVPRHSGSTVLRGTGLAQLYGGTHCHSCQAAIGGWQNFLMRMAKLPDIEICFSLRLHLGPGVLERRKDRSLRCFFIPIQPLDHDPRHC